MHKNTKTNTHVLSPAQQLVSIYDSQAKRPIWIESISATQDEEHITISISSANKTEEPVHVRVFITDDKNKHRQHTRSPRGALHCMLIKPDQPQSHIMEKLWRICRSLRDFKPRKKFIKYKDYLLRDSHQQELDENGVRLRIAA